MIRGTLESDCGKEPIKRSGAGGIVTSDGVVATHQELVECLEPVQIIISDGREFGAKAILSDRTSGLAIIKLKSDKPLPHVEFGDSEKVQVGDSVFSFGSPFGETFTVIHGIISRKGREADGDECF